MPIYPPQIVHPGTLSTTQGPAGTGTAYASDSYGPTLFVNTVTGQAGNSGLIPASPLPTMAAAFALLETWQAADAGSSSNATIYVSGHITEQVETPQNVFGVRIIGLVNGNPRHTTDSGTVLAGNGVDWVAPASPTADEPLLRISEQGWEVRNILMVPGNGIAAIELRREETATYFDPSHSIISGVRFIGASTTNTIGIEDIGGSSQITVEDCIFDTLASGIVNTSTSIANPNRWAIQRNKFVSNTEHIDMPLVGGYFLNNVMDEATVNVDFTGGSANAVNNNNFDNAAANIAPADGYTAGTGDSWQVNQANDAVYYGIPA